MSAELLKVLGTHKEPGLVMRRLVLAAVYQDASDVEGSVTTFDIGNLGK